VSTRLSPSHFVYGQRAEELVREYPHLKQVLCPHTGAIAAEVFGLSPEMAQTLPDIIWRRTMVGWRPDTARSLLEKPSKSPRSISIGAQCAAMKSGGILKAREAYQVPGVVANAGAPTPMGPAALLTPPLPPQGHPDRQDSGPGLEMEKIS